MSEPQAKPFWPQTFTGWVGALTAICALAGMIIGGVKYGWAIGRVIEDVTATPGELRKLTAYVQDTNNRITALDTTVREAKDAQETQAARVKELDRRAPKKGRKPELWEE